MPKKTEPILGESSPVHIGFLMVPEYTLSTFANAVAVLRMANRQSGRELYRWSTLTLDGEPVTSSSNIELVFDGTLDSVDPVDIFMVCGGYNIEKHCSPELLSV